jgi:outer membrane protein OmpA-like peptidoglycan-associated protein
MALQRALGLLFVAAGGALLFLAVQRESDRAEAQRIRAESIPTSKTIAPRAELPRPVSSVRPATELVSSGPSPGPSATASAGPSASASPSASAPASATASASAGAPPPAAAGDGEVFRFNSDILLPKEENTRIVAHAAQLRKWPRTKIVIEAYSDGPGTDPKTLMLARRRGILVRQLFTDVGIEPERISVTTPDAATEPSLAGTVRIRANPPIGEAK